MEAWNEAPLYILGARSILAARQFLWSFGFFVSCSEKLYSLIPETLATSHTCLGKSGQRIMTGGAHFAPVM